MVRCVLQFPASFFEFISNAALKDVLQHISLMYQGPDKIDIFIETACPRVPDTVCCSVHPTAPRPGTAKKVVPAPGTLRNGHFSRDPRPITCLSKERLLFHIAKNGIFDIQIFGSQTPPNPLPPSTRSPVGPVFESALQISLSGERSVERTSAGMGGAPRGRSSPCEHRDNCPTLTCQNNGFPLSVDKQCRQDPENPHRCVRVSPSTFLHLSCPSGT